MPAPPALPWRTALLVVLALLLLAFPTVWFGGRTLRNGPGMPGVVPTGVAGQPATLTPTHTMDSVSAFIDEPLAQVMAAQLRAGHLPLWNPWNGCGAPLLGNMQAAPLSPFRWPVLAWPDQPWVYDAALLLRLAVAGLFTFLYVAQRGLGRVAATVAATAFLLCGYFVLHVTMHHLSVEVLLPALFFFSDRFARHPERRRGAFLGLVLTGWGTIVGGNPEATILVVLPAAAYVLWQVRAWGVRVVLGIGAALLLSAGLGAPYLLAGAEYLANATHHHQGVAAGLDHYQPWTLAAYLAPGVFGDVVSLAPPYLGTAVVALALLGLHRGRAGVPVGFFLTAALLRWAKALGCPGVQLLGRLPVLDMLYFYKYGNPALAFAWAVLAAQGVAMAATAGWRVVAVACGAAVALLAVAGWCLGRALGADVAVHGAPLVVALAVPVVLCALLSTRHRLAPLAATAVLVGELLWAVPRTLPPRLDTYRPAPYVAALTTPSQPFRTFGVEDALPPNVNAALGIADVRSHDGLYAARFDRFIREFLNPNNHSPQFDGRLLYPVPAEELERGIAHGAFFLQRNVAAVLRSHNSFTMDFTSDQKLRGYDLAGVRYVLFNPALKAGAEAFVAARPDRWRMAYAGEMVVLENLRALPRAFLARAARSVADPDAAVIVMHATDFALERSVVVEDPDASLPPLLPPILPAALPDFRAAPGCRITEFLSDRVVIALDAPADGYLVLTDTFFPGWVAEIDGAAAPIVPVDLLFRGVRVTAAAHSVTFRYAPRPFWLGVWVALATAAVATLILVLGRRTLLLA